MTETTSHLTVVPFVKREAPTGVSRDAELAHMMCRMFNHGIFDEVYFLTLALTDVRDILHLLRLGKVPNNFGTLETPPLPFVVDLTTACLLTSILNLAIRVQGFEQKLQAAIDKLNDPYRV